MGSEQTREQQPRVLITNKTRGGSAIPGGVPLKVFWILSGNRIEPTGGTIPVDVQMALDRPGFEKGVRITASSDPKLSTMYSFPPGRAASEVKLAVFAAENSRSILAELDSGIN